MVQKRGFRKKERKKRKAAIPIKYKAKKKKKSLGNRITGPGPVVNVFPRPIAIFLGQGANWLNRTRLPPKTRIVEKQTALLVVVDFLARYQSLILATNLQMVTIFSHLAIFHPTFSRGVNNNIVSSRIFLEGKDREEESIFRRVAGGDKTNFEEPMVFVDKRKGIPHRWAGKSDIFSKIVFSRQVATYVTWNPRGRVDGWNIAGI